MNREVVDARFLNLAHLGLELAVDGAPCWTCAIALNVESGERSGGNLLAAVAQVGVNLVKLQWLAIDGDSGSAVALKPLAAC